MLDEFAFKGENCERCYYEQSAQSSTTKDSAPDTINFDLWLLEAEDHGKQEYAVLRYIFKTCSKKSRADVWGLFQYEGREPTRPVLFSVDG